MIKFFRQIRFKLMSENKTSKYFKYAIGEIILVVIGILIALQINNWNEDRKNRSKEAKILRSLQSNLRTDIKNIEVQLTMKKNAIADYTSALDIISGKKQGTKVELFQDLKTLLQVGGVNLNMTTFNNLQTTGEIRLVKSKQLADSITGYYNTGYIGWQTALRDYTRNQIGPYFMKFDYLPKTSIKYKGTELNYYGETKDFLQPEKTLQDYKKDYFIINALRQKLYNTEGLKLEYKILLDYAKQLDQGINSYLKER